MSHLKAAVLVLAGLAGCATDAPDPDRAATCLAVCAPFDAIVPVTDYMRRSAPCSCLIMQPRPEHPPVPTFREPSSDLRNTLEARR